MGFLGVILGIFALAQSSFCTVTVSLNGLWTLSSESLNLKLPAEVPGTFFTALLSHGIIEDPYKGYHDVEYSYLADADWLYARTFNASKALLSKAKVKLLLEGVDTVSSIHLNGHVIGTTKNMFVHYAFDVKQLLQVNDNLIEVKLESATKYSANQSVLYLERYGYVVPPDGPPAVQHGQKHINFIRKEPCSFSWDWGPSFPTAGVWKSVKLVAFDMAVLSGIFVHTKLEHGFWTISLEIEVDSASDQKIWAVTHIFDDVFKEEIILVAGAVRYQLQPIRVAENEVEMWWPRGYGDPKLYIVKVTLIDEIFDEQTSKSIRVGFRTVELVQEAVPASEGLSFYFKVNKVPIFLKGSNWIPADSFQERVTVDIIENLLNATIDANMNTLRVWGGGVYESDILYDKADELGLMIWQDLMFAVALYPTDSDFLQTVKQEMQSQLVRLQHRACIIVWSANNENELAIRTFWWPEIREAQDLYKADYIKLYVETIKTIFDAEDPTRPFLVSSPSNGIESEKEGYIAADPASELYGDVHFYNYSADCWNVSNFPKPRLASEYGFQSLPSLLTLSPVFDEAELHWNSSLLFHRQHHENGTREIETLIGINFNLPARNGSQEYLHDMIYLSQIYQAVCIKLETEHYRRFQGRLEQGKGNTMGALYWQLNDIWQAPSWSSIEYGGRWKMLHYYARHFFSPVLISGYVQNGTLTVYGVVDFGMDVLLCDGVIKAYNWSSFSPIVVRPFSAVMEPGKSSLLQQVEVDSLCPANGDCFFVLELGSSQFKQLFSKTTVFYKPFKNVTTMRNPNLQIVAVEGRDRKFSVHFTASAPAAFVWLETSVDGHFSDNGMVVTEEENTVMFDSRQSVTAEEIRRSLTVRSLVDIY